MTSFDGADLFDVLQLGGFNDSAGHILQSLLCSAKDSNSTSVQRHDRPSPGAASAHVQFFRVVFDLYVVGVICLVGFIGECVMRFVRR